MIKLFYTNNTIYRKSFVCPQFRCQIVLFHPPRGTYLVLRHWCRVDLGVMAMKGYSPFPSFSITEASLSDCLPSYIKGHSLVAVLLLCRDAVGVFYSPS